jgi:hypothetical protein
MNYRLAYALGPRVSGWEVTDVEVADTEPDVLARLLEFDERFYRLRRNGIAR